MKCCLCGEDRKLVKAHVIPEGFFRRLRSGDQVPHLYMKEGRGYPKRAPVGVYDKEILCKDCEGQFGEWDDYAQKILKPDLIPGNPVVVNGQLAGFEVSDIDTERLGLFFVSLLLRASLSKQDFYGRIDLGEYEQHARRQVSERALGVYNPFQTTLARFSDILGTTILDPHPEQFDGVRYFRFYLGGYVAYIKCDERPAPGYFGLFAMQHGQPLQIVVRNLRKSQEFLLIKDMIAANNSLQARRP